MKNQTIIVDFDNTIANSCETVIALYEYDFLKPVQQIDLTRLYWDFSPYIPYYYLNYCLRYFADKRFYERLKIYPDCYEVLKELSIKYKIIICTKKVPEAIKYNDDWIKKNLPFIENVVYLRQHDFKKDFIKGDYRIDDKIDCLENCNDSKNILFGKYGYNIGQDSNKFTRCVNWKEVKEYFDNL